MYSGLSKRGIATVTRGQCRRLPGDMIEDIKSCQPEVKASKSVKRLRSYGYLMICIVSYLCWWCADTYSSPCRRLLGKFLTTLMYWKKEEMKKLRNKLSENEKAVLCTGLKKTIPHILCSGCISPPFSCTQPFTQHYILTLPFPQGNLDELATQLFLHVAPHRRISTQSL